MSRYGALTTTYWTALPCSISAWPRVVHHHSVRSRRMDDDVLDAAAVIHGLIVDAATMMVGQRA